MTKATLKFDLNDPEDTNAFKTVQMANGMHAALWEIDQALRSHEKYNAESLTRLRFHEILRNYNVDLD